MCFNLFFFHSGSIPLFCLTDFLFRFDFMHPCCCFTHAEISLPDIHPRHAERQRDFRQWAPSKPRGPGFVPARAEDERYYCKSCTYAVVLPAPSMLIPRAGARHRHLRVLRHHRAPQDRVPDRLCVHAGGTRDGGDERLAKAAERV